MIRTSAAGRTVRRTVVGVVSAAAVLAGAGMTATSAMAATHVAPAGVHQGVYHSWKAAQKAAQFSLLRPGGTDGLKPDGGIAVVRCAGYRPPAATVSAGYGHPGGRFIGLIQDDAPRAAPCSNIGEASVLGHYRVDGARATLLGAHRWLFLTWTRHGRYYLVLTHDESRGSTVALGRQLRSVS
jgi:hypothetical protein